MTENHSENHSLRQQRRELPENFDIDWASKVRIGKLPIIELLNSPDGPVCMSDMPSQIFTAFPIKKDAF